MFENIMNFFKKLNKKEEKKANNSKDAAKERLHLVLMQDRANVSADFLDMMKQEIIEVIKKYIDVDESAIDVRLTNKENEDGTNGAPALYANIPILNIKNEVKKEINKENNENKSTETATIEEKNEIKEPKETAQVIIDNGKENTMQKEQGRKEENKEDEKKQEEVLETVVATQEENTKEELKSENN